jgi:hypothetical protein
LVTWRGFRSGIALLVLLAVCLLFLAAGDSGPAVCADLDGDGDPEAYSLGGHRLIVTERGQVFWLSDRDWRVDGFALGDVDNDGADELVLSLWKTGSFGAIRPFWHTGEDVSYKNHLFVFRLREDTFHSVWCSSDLDNPIVSFSIRDVDGDGLNELITEEGRYRRVAAERYALDTGGPSSTTLWQWGQWGFSRKRPDS